MAAGLAKKCEIQLSYAIGVAQPTSIMVDTFGTGKISDEELVTIIRQEFDLRPAGIMKNAGSSQTYLQANSSLWSFWKR